MSLPETTGNVVAQVEDHGWDYSLDRLRTDCYLPEKVIHTKAGDRMQLRKTLNTAGLVLAMVAVLSCGRGEEKDDKVVSFISAKEQGVVHPARESTSTQKAVTPAIEDPLPPPLTNAMGREFDKKVMRYHERWWNTLNEIKKTAIFDELINYTKVFFETTTQVEDWTASIQHMGTQEGGNGVCLMIELAGSADSDHVGFSQGCSGNLFSPDPNSIKKGTKVYQQLGNLGDEYASRCVLVSGEVNPLISDSDDEISAMRHPSFTMIFTEIKNCPARARSKKKVAETSE